MIHGLGFTKHCSMESLQMVSGDRDASSFCSSNITDQFEEPIFGANVDELWTGSVEGMKFYIVAPRQLRILNFPGNACHHVNDRCDITTLPNGPISGGAIRSPTSLHPNHSPVHLRASVRSWSPIPSRSIEPARNQPHWNLVHSNNRHFWMLPGTGLVDAGSVEHDVDSDWRDLSPYGEVHHNTGKVLLTTF